MSNKETQFRTANDQVVTIDGIDYKATDLSDTAKQQMMNIKVTDEEIQRLERLLAIARTARVAYGQALLEAMPDPEAARQAATANADNNAGTKAAGAKA